MLYFKHSFYELRVTLPHICIILGLFVVVSFRNSYFATSSAPSSRNLELRYPYYPTAQDFTHSVLSSGDVVREDIALLSRFSLQWRRLQAGGELLPDLVELYQWLHTDLAHLVSYNKACTVTIRKVINRAMRKYSRDRGQHLEQLFLRVKG